MRVFRTKADHTVGHSMLSITPSERLCNLVRRLCVTEIPKAFTADHLRRLTRLHTVYDSALVRPLLNSAPMPALRHFCECTERWPQAPPRTITHMALFYPLGVSLEPRLTTAKAWIAAKLPESVTNLAISFSDSLASPNSATEAVTPLLKSLLQQERLISVVIWLYQSAASQASYSLALHTIATLPDDDRQRVEIWRDLREGSDTGESSLRITDVVAGRTPFTEAESFRHAQMAEARRIQAEAEFKKRQEGQDRSKRGRGRRRR